VENLDADGTDAQIPDAKGTPIFLEEEDGVARWRQVVINMLLLL
jgi:hypothetical protein